MGTVMDLIVGHIGPDSIAYIYSSGVKKGFPRITVNMVIDHLVPRWLHCCLVGCKSGGGNDHAPRPYAIDIIALHRTIVSIHDADPITGAIADMGTRNQHIGTTIQSDPIPGPAADRDPDEFCI